MKIFKIGTIYRSSAIFLGTCLLGLNLSCNFLEVEPKEMTKDKDFLENFWDADFMMRGVYGSLQNIVEPLIVLGETRADWMEPGTGADKDILELAEHKVTPGNRYTNWSAYYDAINRANYAIENLPRVPKDSTYFNYRTMMQLTGEAKFVRSLAYFHLVRNFKDVPLIRNSIKDISDVQYLAATDGNIVLDSVEADLKFALIHTPRLHLVLNTFDIGFRESGENNRMRAKKGDVYSLMAHVYLWRNKYTDAMAALDAMYTLSDQNGMYYHNPQNFFANASWFNIFREPSQIFQEYLFEIGFRYDSRELAPFMPLMSNDAASGGKHLIAPSLYAIKSYHPNYPTIPATITTATLATDDMHRGFGRSFAGSAPFYNKAGSTPVVWKWLGLDVVNPSTVNVPPSVRLPYESEGQFRFMRMGDTWLLRAETLNRLNRRPEAVSVLNNIRGRVSRPASTVTGTSTIEQIEDAILQERGLELGFEGQRWYDLMRIANHRGSTQYLVDAVKRRAPLAQHAYLQSRLSNKDYWYLPYNANEVRLNPNLNQRPY
ncbi:RagB/SusD family nutrient uptake outer membrane protein [Paradesertivirga mongoliensis]|uniref:RagB/SusD family nutrient uptake outer membrane protein n=1 Tax=Paradesertivirga mongoliensis TaxID=2100740 RepID=A0ABW4ZME9_9SPHI|nr:RagB/SusD family nutrient uptake outer membrane protein [Pedobacter mongoliensis]